MTDEAPQWEDWEEGFDDRSEYTLSEIRERLQPYLNALEGWERVADEAMQRANALQGEADVLRGKATLADEMARYLHDDYSTDRDASAFGHWLADYDALTPQPHLEERIHKAICTCGRGDRAFGLHHAEGCEMRMTFEEYTGQPHHEKTT